MSPVLLTRDYRHGFEVGRETVSLTGFTAGELSEFARYVEQDVDREGDEYCAGFAAALRLAAEDLVDPVFLPRHWAARAYQRGEVIG